MAITKIGTKLIGDGAITTVKLGSQAVTRADIQSASVQVTHLDVNQGASGHVDFVDDDFFIAGDATNNNARGFSFSQLKTALSLSNAARGDETTVQYNNGSGFDGIAKIRTDGVHLTASDGGKIVLAYTGISGSTGELFASSKTALTIQGTSEILLHSSGTVQGNQSASFGISAAGLIPAVKPAVAASPATFKIQFTSGSIGKNSGGGDTKTYGPLDTYTAQLVTLASTGSETYYFFLSGSDQNTPLPISASINIYASVGGKYRRDIPVEVITGVTDWRDVVQNMYNAMNTELPAGLASVSLNSTSSINGTASIEIAYNAAANIRGGVSVGAGQQTTTGGGRITAFGTITGAPQPSDYPAPFEGQFQFFGTNNHGNKADGEPDDSGAELIIVVSGNTAINEDRTWTNLGSSTYKFDNVYADNISGSNYLYSHKLNIDVATIEKLTRSAYSSRPVFISGSGTANLHVLDVDEATIGGVTLTSVRDSAAYAITGSGTANFHKINADLGTIDKVAALVVTGSGTTQLHKIDSDLGTIDRVQALVVTGSGTSLFHKLTVDEGTYRDVHTTAISGSGLVEFHNITAGDVSGSIGEFHKINTDHVNARVIRSDVTTTENLEIDVKQLIPAVSQSAGAAQEGAGLQIGGTAGSGSAGIASVVLGDAGSGAGADLLFKIGATQGASLSGSVSDGGQRFGVTGSLSASIGVFHEITVNQDMGAQDSIFSGSSFTGHLLSGSTAQAHFLDANSTQIADVSGSSMTYHTLTGSEVNAHRVTGDVVTIADVSGSSAVYHTLSGSTLTVNLVEADRLTGDVDVSGQISGSGTSTLHKVTTDELSSSIMQLHHLGTGASGYDPLDVLTVGAIEGDDIIKKAHLNQAIVRSNNNAHGGLNFDYAQLSVGWRKRIFSRSSKALINRTQPTQGSGSLYTTCSLSETRMVSGSEMVYFNGLLLTKDNGAAGNPQQGDYTIDYNGGGGLQKGVFRFVFYSGSTGTNSGGYSTIKKYGPGEQYMTQLLAVQSTGSNNGEYYLFYLDDASDPVDLPVSSSSNMEYGNLASGKKRHDISVEAISGVTDWRDVVTNFYNAMNTELNTNAGVATVSLNSTASINGTASIEIRYTGEIEGLIFAGDGATTNNGFNGRYNNTSNSQIYSPSANPSIGLFEEFGSDLRSGVETTILTSGSTIQAGTEIFLSENLAMDSDDVLVVQYLSGAAPLG